MDTLAEQCARRLANGGMEAAALPVFEKGGVYLAENGRVRIANHILGGAVLGTTRPIPCSIRTAALGLR